MNFPIFPKIVILIFTSTFLREIFCLELEKLIVNSAQSLATSDRDLSEEGYEAFLMKSKQQSVLFTAKKYPEKSFKIPDDDGSISKKNIIIIGKQQDGLDPSETHTRVVLIQSSRRRQTYTAHIAYIRIVDGEISVEWDYYEARPILQYKSFFTALSPGEYYQNSPVGDELKGNVTDRRVLGFLAHVRNKLFDVACLVTVFIPRWCRKHDIPEVKPLKLNDTRVKANSSSKAKVFQSAADYSFEDYSSSFSESIESTKKGRKLSGKAREKRPFRKQTKNATTDSSSKENEKDSFHRKDALKGKTAKNSKLENKWFSPDSTKINAKNDSELFIQKLKAYLRNGKNNTTTKKKLPHPMEPGSSSESDSEEEQIEEIRSQLSPKIREKQQKKQSEAASSSPSKVQDRPRPKFRCPVHSGAILEDDKCYCPPKTVLQGKKCLNKTKTSNNRKELIQEERKDAPNNDTTRTTGFGRFRQADASNQPRADPPTKQKRRADQEAVDSFDAEIIQPNPLGPFYKPVQMIHFDKDVAQHVFQKIPPKALEFLHDRYRIANNPRNGHPEYESSRTPFVGIMDCNYEERKWKSFNGTLKHNIVDYLLHALRAQCHRNLRKNTLELFDEGVVQIKKSPHYYVVIVKDHWLLNQDTYSKEEWQDFISAIYISCFSEAFGEQQVTLDRGISDNISPDRERISQTIRTLTVFVEKVMHLLRQPRFRNHAVKITKALVSTISAFTQRVHKQGFLVELFCKACREERKIFNQDLRQLYVLSQFAIIGFHDVVHNYMSFEEFYKSLETNFD